MVSGLDESLVGEDDAPLLRSVTVVVASVPWSAPEEWRMEGEDRAKSIAPAPACTIPGNETAFFCRYKFSIIDENMGETCKQNKKMAYR